MTRKMTSNRPGGFHHAISSGYDGQDFYIQDVDSDGAASVKGIVATSPMVDIDTTYTYNPDGTPAQKVEVGLGNTKTTVYTWLNGVLQSKAVVIT